MKQCAICSKTYLVGGMRKLLRGHYNPTNTSRKQPNLQWLSLPGKTGRIKACTKCIRKAKEKSSR